MNYVFRFVVIILLVTIVSCTSQTNTVLPDSGIVDSVSVTSAPTISTQPTATKPPLPATLIIPTITPYQPINTSYASLPTGQYIISAEASECEQNSAWIACNDLRVLSVDGSVNKLLVEDLPGSGFIFHNGRVAFTSTMHDPNQQRHQVRVFSFVDGVNSEIQNPARKECMAEDWSLDGEQLIVLCRSKDDYRFFEIALLSIEDGEFVTIMLDPNEGDSSSGYEQVRLSPNGKWLAFYRLFSKGPKLVEGLYITDMACLSELSTCRDKTYRFPVEKLVGKLGNHLIDWTSDGYLSMALDNVIEIYDVNSNQKIDSVVINLKDDDIYKMSWSPDGKWIIMDHVYALGSLLVSTENWEPVHLTTTVENPFWITIP